jgi:hypothetical protein
MVVSFAVFISRVFNHLQCRRRYVFHCSHAAGTRGTQTVVTLPWYLGVPFCGKMSPQFTPIKSDTAQPARSLLLSGVSSSLLGRKAVLHID